MNAFDECRELESASRKHLQQHLLKEMVYEGRYVRIEKGPMAREFQLTSGDYVWNSDELTAWRVEHKCEYANTYGNFFLETFSNKSRGKLGWLYTNGADFLLYHFLKSGDVYLLRLDELRAWLYEHISVSGRPQPRAHRYAEKQQARYNQLNDTWGYCVCIEDIDKGVTMRKRRVPALVIEEHELRLGREQAGRSNGQSDLWNGA